jgi:Cd2+/Zn2+-exporting ATPase
MKMEPFMSDIQKLRLDLPLVLPDIYGAEDRCVSRLQDKLADRPGIEGLISLARLKESRSCVCTTTPP